MATLQRLKETGLKQLSRGAVFCGAPTIGLGAGGVTGESTIDGTLPLVAVLGAFLGAGVWMFRRWGKSPEAQAPLVEPSPGVAAGIQQERELVNT